MADPLGSIGAGDISPFMKSFSTVDTSLKLLRDLRDRGESSGGGALTVPELPPSTRIWIRNDTGSDLSAGYVVKLGAGVTAYTGDDQHAFRKTPILKGTTPSATSNNFAILSEPAAAYSSSTGYSYARAVTLGEAVCDINITDASHGYATPTASDYTKLTSAASGPVIILDRESGTGTKRATVLMTGQVTANSTTLATDQTGDLAHTITADGTYQTVSSSSLTLPSAGTYLIYFQVHGSAAISAFPSSNYARIEARLRYVAGSVTINEVTVVALEQVTTGSIFAVPGCGGGSIVYDAPFSHAIEMQAWRSSGPTWTTSDIGPGGGSSKTHWGYLKIG